MSLDYIQGRMEPETPFHIVSKKIVKASDSNSLFSAGSSQNSGDNYWSFLGVQEDYVNYYDVMTDPFYYCDNTGTEPLYYYPLYLCDRGSGVVSYASGIVTVTTDSTTVTIPDTSNAGARGFANGQNVIITANSGIGTATGIVSVNQQNGVESVTNIVVETAFTTNDTVTIKGLVSNPLFSSSDPIKLTVISFFKTGQNGIASNGELGSSPGALITLFTSELISGTGLPSFDTGTQTMTGGSSPPHPDLKYRSWDAIKNIPFVVYDRSYYYPLYMYNFGNNTTSVFSTTSLITFYYDSNLTTAGTGTSVSPNTDRAKCMFYNPYNSLMNSLFKYTQNEDGTINLYLISAGHYMESAHDYQYISYDSTGKVFASKTESVLKPFILEPVDDTGATPITYNVNASKIYAGVPYKFKINETSANAVFFDFIGGLDKQSATDYLTPYFGKDGIDGSGSGTNFIANTEAATDYLNPQSLSQSYSDNTIILYFIPATETSYDLVSQNLMTNLDYTATDMLTMCPNVFNVRPLQLNTSILGYYDWQTTKGVPKPNELAFASQMSGSFLGLSYDYCTGSNTCGSCFGKCDKNTTVNPTTQCVYDSLSGEKHSSNGEIFTCNHERFYEKSDYVAASFIENHSHTGIIIVIVVGIILAAGFILYEERNRISKEFLHLKKS